MMSYKVSAKNRKLKRTLVNIISILKFESLNITTAHKISLVWVVLSMIWLFINWIDSFDGKIVWNWFDTLLWITWYILFILNIKILFIILNSKQKEMIKNFFNFNAKDGVLIVMMAAFWLFFTINSIFVIENFSFFQEWIVIWKWLILSIIWYIFWILWGFLILKSKTINNIYVDSKEEYLENNQENNIENENNMKLPF